MARSAHLLNIRDVTARTRLGRSTIYKELGTGRLRSVKVGSRRLIPEDALLDFISALGSGDPALAVRLQTDEQTKSQARQTMSDSTSAELPPETQRVP